VVRGGDSAFSAITGGKPRDVSCQRLRGRHTKPQGCVEIGRLEGTLQIYAAARGGIGQLVLNRMRALLRGAAQRRAHVRDLITFCRQVDDIRGLRADTGGFEAERGGSYERCGRKRNLSRGSTPNKSSRARNGSGPWAVLRISD